MLSSFLWKFFIEFTHGLEQTCKRNRGGRNIVQEVKKFNVRDDEQRDSEAEIETKKKKFGISLDLSKIKKRDYFLSGKQPNGKLCVKCVFTGQACARGLHINVCMCMAELVCSCIVRIMTYCDMYAS